MKRIVYFFLIAILVSGFYYSTLPVEKDILQTPKINGASLESPHFELHSSDFVLLNDWNTEWVAIIPYAFSHATKPQVHFNHEFMWWGEKLNGVKTMIRLAHQQGIGVMLKPHVWISEGWVGDFLLDNEQDWEVWEDQYRSYVLAFAKLAEETGVKLFCIGTEYKLAVKYRPHFWKDLIQEVRDVYSGKLTYAANWDNYQQVTFWDELDYIGIDAYFPLVHQSNCSLEELKHAWKPLKVDISEFSKQLGKPVLFTEYGYQSADGATGNHWEIEKYGRVTNEELQGIAYQALFDTFWSEPWFAGGFWWKWHFGNRYLETRPTSFTPQGKKAEKVITDFYGKNRSLSNDQ